MHRGYFIHARKTTDWFMRDNPNAYSVWMYLLEMASGTERKTYFAGEEFMLKPGQLVTGRIKISKATGVSQTSVERYLNMFEKCGQIGQQKTNKSRLITITNWGDYQFNGQQTDNKRTTNGQQTDNNRKGREGKKRNIFMAPTLEEVTSYCLERGNSVDPSRFMSHYEANGWKVGRNAMKDWRAAVRTWEGKEEASSWRRA